MRHQHADRAAVEHRKDVRGGRLGDAHDAGGAARARGEQTHIDRDAVERCVFLVDHHEVVAEIAEDLDRMTGGRLDEGADELLAGGEALAEIGGYSRHTNPSGVPLF